MLAWADACLVAFSTSDRSSFDALESIKTKVERYKRGTEVPCIFVAVSGLNGQDVAAGEGSAGSADPPRGSARAAEEYVCVWGPPPAHGCQLHPVS